MEIISTVEYKNEELHTQVKRAADKKFGTGSSYVKSLWILREYKSKGGKVSYKGERPTKNSIKKQVKGSEDVFVVAINYNCEDCEDFDDSIFGDEQEVTCDIEASEAKRKLNKPFRTPDGPKKFSVYVKNEKGNIVKVNFGDPNLEIKRDDPARRKSFRARMKCATPGPKWKARYWACKTWESGKTVSDIVS
jgi:hypothetical protein